MHISKDLKTKLKDSIPILLFSLAWMLFILSAFRYQSLDWFYVLLASRVVVVSFGLLVVGLILIGRDTSRLWNNLFFTLTLAVQTLHGVLEGPASVEFYSYTGVIFLVSSLGINSEKRQWQRVWLPLQVGILIVPMFFKSHHLTWPLSSLVDNFSLPIAGLCLGLIVSSLNASRIASMQKNLHLQNTLLKEKETWNSRLVSEVNRLKEDLKIKADLEAFTKVSDQVAHDIRSPLAALRMAVNNTTFTEPRQETVIRLSIARITEIVSDLSSARGNLKSIAANQAESSLFSACSLVEAVVVEKREEFLEICELKFLDDSDAREARLFVNESILKRIISNVINNAVEAKQGSKVEIAIKCKKAHDFFEISILDSGKGISPEILPNLGKEGFSLGKDGHPTSGSGLGLYHAFSVIKAWGGRIVINSKLDEGTEVIIELPLA